MSAMLILLFILSGLANAELNLHKDPLQMVELSTQFSGLDPDLTHKIVTGLSIKAAEQESKLTEERVELVSELSQEEIYQHLEALGYYRSKVDFQLKRIAPKKFQASYHIQKGPPTYIHSVNIQVVGPGANQPFLKAILLHPTLIQGTQLNHQTYEEAKEELLGKALQLGYLDAQFVQNEIRISPDKSQAHIFLKLNTDKRYHFGAITFRDKRYPSSYLERYIPFRPGDPYTTEQISALQESLVASDLFSQVRIFPEEVDSEHLSVPIEVRLKDRPLNTYTAGIGYGDETGFRGNAGLVHRLETYPGHQISTNVQVSQKRNYVNGFYTIPGLDPSTERLIMGSEATREKFKGKLSKRMDTSVVQICKTEDWEQVLGLHYLQEKFREANNDPFQHTHYLFPSAGYIWRNIKKTTPFPHGSKMQFTLKGAVKQLCSSTNFVQVEIEPKWIILLGQTSRLILRADLGTTYITKHQRLPLSLRFFAGGVDTIRGYEYNTLGPKERNAKGKKVVIGGRSILVGSMEVEKQIQGNLSGAVFVDGGNAMNNFSTALVAGAGFGVRYSTPLGPFRLDIANPVKTKLRPQLHFSFGIDL